MDHDALFKKLLKTPTVLPGLFEAFVPDAAKFIDFGVLEFIDKELFTIEHKRRTGDLLVKTRFRGEDAGFLIHLEHQAQLDSSLPRRMLEYFILDWREYDLPVYPIAVLSYSEAGPRNLVPLQVDFPNRRILTFEFDLIDLGRLDAGTHVRIPNAAALALAARMRCIPRKRVSLTRDFFITLAQTAGDARVKKNVAGFFSAYQPLSSRQALQLERELGKLASGPVREKVMNLTNPFIELGKERGRQEGLRRGRQEGLKRGREEGEADLVLKLLGRRLGALTAAQEKAVRKLPLSKIEELGEALLEFTSRGELAHWLGLNK